MSLFLDVHGWYCEKAYKDKNILLKDIKSNPKFKVSEDSDNAFVYVIDGTRYTVTVNADACATDVVLKNKGDDRPLIFLHDIEASLEQKGYRQRSAGKLLMESTSDNALLSVLALEYANSGQERAVLTYPLVSYPPDLSFDYRMTLSVAKLGTPAETMEPGPHFQPCPDYVIKG